VPGQADLAAAHDQALAAARRDLRKPPRRVSNPESYRDQVVPRLLADLETAPAHTGNHNLNRVAFRLYQFVFAGVYGEDEAVRSLTTAMHRRSATVLCTTCEKAPHRPIVDPREIARTLASARHAAAYRPDVALVEAVRRSTGVAPLVTETAKAEASDLEKLLAQDAAGISRYDLAVAALAQVASDLAASGMNRQGAARRALGALRDRAPQFRRLLGSAATLRSDATKMDGTDVLAWQVARSTRPAEGVSPGRLMDANARMRVLFGALRRGVSNEALTAALRRAADPNPVPPFPARVASGPRPDQPPVEEQTVAEEQRASVKPDAGPLFVDLSASGGGATELWKAVSSATGLSSDPAFSVLEVGLARQGKLEAFRKAVLETTGRPWASWTEVGGADALRTMASAMNHLDPSYPDPTHMRFAPPPPPELTEASVAHHVLGALEMLGADSLAVNGEMSESLRAALAATGVQVHKAKAASVPMVRGMLSLDGSDLAQLGGASVASGDPTHAAASSPPRRGHSLDPAQLSDKQVGLLVRQIRGEDPKAAQEATALLMARLEPLIGAALNRVGLKGEDRDDARTAAQEAALRTLGRYEPDSGAKLTTFVFPRIRGAVLNYIERERSMRAGSFDAEREHQPVMSFDQGFDENDDWVSLEERIGDEHAADPQQEATSKDTSDRLARVFGALPERDRNVLRWRFGFDGEALSYDEIGKRLGVSGEMARRIEAQAIEMARKRPTASLLGDETLAHRTPPAGVEELARAARRIQRASIDGQKVSLKTAIGIAITRERELHPNHVEHLERESPGGLALRIDEALHGRPSEPVPPPPPPPVPAATQTKEAAFAWS